MERLDPRQLATVLRLTLGQALRSGRDVSSGARARPWLQVTLSMAVFGAVFAQNAWRCADLASYVVLVFASALALVSFAVLPETQEARQGNQDVLSCRPVPAGTFLVARAISLTALAGLIGVPFGTVAALGGAMRFPQMLPATPLLLLALLVQGFVVATLWVTLLLFLVGRVSVARVRRVSQTVFLLFIVAVSVLSAGLLGASSRFARAEHPWLSLLPPSWFARLPLPGWEPPLLLERAAAVALLLVALAVALSRTLARRFGEQLELVAEAHVESVRRSATVRLLERTARWRAGRWLIGAPAAALAAAIVRSGQREEVSRLRTMGLRVLALVLFGMGLAAGRGFALATLGYLVYSNTLDGLEVARQSSDAPASFLLWKAPLRGGQLLSALEAAVFLRSAVLPLALATGLLFLRVQPVMAALLALGLALAGRATLAASLVLWPSLPLAREQRSTQSFLGLGTALVLSIGSTVAGGILIVLAEQMPVLAVALASLALVVLGAVTYGLRYWAGRRLDAVECPY